MTGSFGRSGTGPSVVIAGAAAIWGLYWAPLRAVEALGVEGPWAVVVFNLPALTLAVIIWLALMARRGPEGMRAVFLSGLMAGLGMGFYASGLLYTSVVRATLLFYLTPIWGTLLAMAFLGERPGLRRWLALGMGLAGLALTLGLSPVNFDFSFGLGEAMGLISGMFWALAALLVRKGQGGPAAPWVLIQFMTVVAVTMAIALIAEAPAPTPGQLGAVATSWITPMSLLILLSLYAIFWAMALMSPGRSGLLMMTEVVVAVITATIFLPEEAMSAVEWAGAGLIVLAGVVEVSGEG